MIDDIDARFRKPKRPEPKVLEPHRPGQDCPMPRCHGTLVLQGLTDQHEVGGLHLRCSDPACSWREHAT